MNFRVGPDDLTCDIDYKHVFKRLRNTLLRANGTTVNGIQITPSVLRVHLLASGLSETSADALLNPRDRQNVPNVYRLLATIMKLPDTAEDASDTTRLSRRALRLLGRIYFNLLDAYTNISLSLHEQLTRLSTACHLVMQLYISGKDSFIPSQLYIDIMIMVKNAFFCVAKTQSDDPTGRFWIILLGDDRLEKSFGFVRTTVGSDSNADCYQLGGRLMTVVQIALIMAEHPEWDRGSQKLHLKPLADSTIEGNKVDHLNPTSWEGDNLVAHVSLLTSWNTGRDAAEQLLVADDISPDFDDMSKTDGYDIFCPFGGSRSVLVDCGDKDDSLDPTSSEDATLTSVTGDDFEDTIAAGEADAAFENGESDFPSWVPWDGEQVSKGELLRHWSDPKVHANSNDRLSRIVGLSRFKQKTTFSATASDNIEPTLEVDDPAATLIVCDNTPFLALVRITGLQVDGTPASSVLIAALKNTGVQITGQILTLSVVHASTDWQWLGLCEGPGPSGRVSFHGKFAQQIQPRLSASDDGERSKISYRFTTNELLNLTADLFNRFSEDEDRLPQGRITDTFPYRTAMGE